MRIIALEEHFILPREEANLPPGAHRGNDREKLLGFDVEGGRIPRQGAGLFHGGREVGKVTSGTKSPTLGKVICMGYVPSGIAKESAGFEVEVSGKRYPLRPTALPLMRSSQSPCWPDHGVAATACGCSSAPSCMRATAASAP